MSNSFDGPGKAGELTQSDTVVGVGFDDCPHSGGLPVIDGNYELLELIGRGGMGAVYRCRHNILNKDYAIKLLTCRSLDDTHWARFQLEARALARLNHPGVVGIHNMGIDRGSTPYFVMDLIDGMSLADLLRERGKLAGSEALDIFLQLADALCAAHQQGIVHRDLKPSNIMLIGSQAQLSAQSSAQKTGEGCKVKVVDFGLARVAGAVDGALTLTKAGTVFGTPLYMSPEQALGLKVDGRSDIYSLGCVFFETLSGRPPFRGATAMDTLMMHQIEEVPPLSSLVKVAPGLEYIVARMLRRSLAERYADMQEVREDLLLAFKGLDNEPSNPKLKRQSQAQPGSRIKSTARSRSTIDKAFSDVASEPDFKHPKRNGIFETSERGLLESSLQSFLLAGVAVLILLLALSGVFILPKLFSASLTAASSAVHSNNNNSIDDFNLDGDVGIVLERNFRNYLAAHKLLCTRAVGGDGRPIKRFVFPDFEPSVLAAHNLGYLREENGKFHRLSGCIEIPAEDKTYLYLQVACQNFPSIFRYFGPDNLAGLEVVTNDVPQVIASLEGARGLTHLSFFNSLERSPGFDESVLLKEHVPLLNSLQGITSLGLCGQLYVGEPVHGEEFTGKDVVGLTLLQHLDTLALQEIKDVRIVLQALEPLEIRKLTLVRCRLTDADVRLISRCRSLEEVTLFQNDQLSTRTAESFLAMPRLRRLTMDNDWAEPEKQKFGRKVRCYKYENYRGNRRG